MRTKLIASVAIAAIAALLIGGLKAQDSRPKSQPKKADSQPKVEKAQHAGLLDPAKANEKAPEKYKVKFETTQGDVIIEVTRAWAPKGADRFYNLVKIGYFQDAAFFRVIAGFMAQFGLHADPKVTKAWRRARIQDDPVTQSNTPGMVSFATSGKNSRTTQLFINYGSNGRLDGMGFSPFGKVLGDGMTVMKKIYSGYGEGAPRGRGPSQGTITMRGNDYLKKSFPKLDYIKKASLMK